jgi:hypothetical protein
MAVRKAIENGLINFGQKSGASNYLGYRESYKLELCFASGNIFKRANHYSKEEIQSSQIEWS